MNMIYVVLLCYANGTCVMGNGDPVYTYFNTFEACERMVQVHNQGHLRNADMKAACFVKPGLQPVHQPSYSDVPPPDPCAKFPSTSYALMACREQEEKDVDAQIEREWKK